MTDTSRADAHIQWVLWLAVLLTATLAAAGSPARAQDEGADSALAPESIEELGRQLDEAKELEEPNTELWEEYRRYRVERKDMRRSAERVEIGGSITVDADEAINGDAVAVGGAIHVYGLVAGDAVAIGGNIVLHEGARVEGDAVSVGGRVIEEGDAEVLGERVSVDIGMHLPFGDWNPGWNTWAMGKPRWFSFAFDFTWLFAVLGVSLLVYALAGRRLDVVSRRIDDEPGQSFLIGLLGAFATPFAFIVTLVLLAITLIGILLIPVLVILVVVLAAAGFVAAALTVGRRISIARAGDTAAGSGRSPYFHVLIGFLALNALGILSTFLELGGPRLMPFALLFGVLAFFIVAFASILGYGALLTSRFGTEPAVSPAAAVAGTLPPPPPPPAPTEPPAPTATPVAPHGPTEPEGPSPPEPPRT